MPTHPPPSPLDTPPLGHRDIGPDPMSPLFVADWKDVVFLHFALPAADLAPHVPLPLDVVNGRGFISLVCFNLQRMRPGRLIPPGLGRALLRPLSDHAFINVRTYVRGPAGPGIHFLTEWIDNRLNLPLGPLIYGLPYRFAEITRADRPAGGVTQIRVTEPRGTAALGITVPFDPTARLAPCGSGTLDEFLVERYTAYTHTRGKTRFFHIAHEPWQVNRIDLVRTDTSLVEQRYPWFKHAELVSAHLSPGLDAVGIGRPHVCALSTATVPVEAHALPSMQSAIDPR